MNRRPLLPTRPQLAFALLCTTLGTAPLAAQGPVGEKAEAKAEARADASGPRTSRATHTVTHRVVVRNGETIVDERTENGRRVPSGKGGRAGGPAGLPGLPPGDDPQARLEEMMKRMLEEARRGAPGLPPLPDELRPLPRDAAPRGGHVVRERASAGDRDAARDSKSSPDAGRGRPSTPSKRSTPSRPVDARPTPDGAGRVVPPRSPKR